MRSEFSLTIPIWFWLVQDFVVAQSPTLPRWGQAAALVQDTLYIHGGRTDQYNSYSYSSAPVTNDFFSLSLASSFDTSSPSWQYIGGCSNCSSDQGPAVAWHTLSAFNLTDLLLFGGDPGPNSPISLPVRADSAALLSVSNGQEPTWDFETSSWANEPVRRIYHSASSSNGKIWIVGGSKADGSDAAFQEHFVFDPQEPSFTQLSSTNAPPDIYGHQSVVLPNGWLLVLGGYSPSQKSLIAFTDIWAIDTAHPDLGWTTLEVSNASLPLPRRGFAATSLNDGRVLIHGGADAVMQQTFDDGWILNTNQKPVNWSSVDALSQLGPRRDHFATTIGQDVLFGFGYASNGPASASLSVFDLSSNTFLSTFTPPHPAPTMTTLPGTSPTGSPNDPSGPQPSGSSPSGTSPSPTSAEFPYPSSTSTPGSHNPNEPNGSPNDPDDPSGGQGDKSHTTAIALGTVFGVVALVVGAGAATWYSRRRRSQESFHLLSHSGDDEDSPHTGPIIPIAGAAGAMREKSLPLPPMVRNVTNRLANLVPGQHPPIQRRDMLADEDTRVFDNERAGWWGAGVYRDTSSGRSSTKRPGFGDRVYGSLVSLRSAGGAVLGYAAGAVMREGSAGSRSTAAWRKEKDVSDPFADDWSLIKAAPSTRPRGGRQGSSYTYVDPYDPFEDYDVESLKSSELHVYQDHPSDNPETGVPSLNDPPPKPYYHTVAHPASLDLTRMTPVSEKPSLSTVTEQSGATPSGTPTDSTQSIPLSPFGTLGRTSTTSHEAPRSPHRPSSIIDAIPSSSTSMGRSNSWWTRFYKTPRLDRRSSDASRRSQPLDFRDPNPPPRLNPIEEAQSPETPSKQGSRESSGGNPGQGHPRLYSSQQHGRSASSLQTAKTANSETIEKMGRTMDIVQRERGSGTMSSHDSGPSMSSIEEDALETGRTNRPLSIVTGTSSNAARKSAEEEPEFLLFQSPEQLTAGPSAWLANHVRSKPPSPPRRPASSARTSSGGKVAERIQAYERRMSQQQDDPSPKSPPPVRSPMPKSKRVSYGVVPKSPLFVTNPDRGRGSNSSTDS